MDFIFAPQRNISVLWDNEYPLQDVTVLAAYAKFVQKPRFAAMISIPDQRSMFLPSLWRAGPKSVKQIYQLYYKFYDEKPHFFGMDFSVVSWMRLVKRNQNSVVFEDFDGGRLEMIMDNSTGLTYGVYGRTWISLNPSRNWKVYDFEHINR